MHFGYLPENQGDPHLTIPRVKVESSFEKGAGGGTRTPKPLGTRS